MARGASFAAAKGAGLIALAVIIGVVLLNVVDDGDTNQGSNGSGSSTETTASTAGATDTTKATTETTADSVPAKTPAELSVLVLNGGAPQGSAKEMSDNLKLSGYTNQGQPADWAGHQQAGNVVMCKAGLDQEAAALATAVGEGHTRRGVCGSGSARQRVRRLRRRGRHAGLGRHGDSPRSRARAGPFAMSIAVHASASEPSRTARSADVLMHAAANSGW